MALHVGLNTITLTMPQFDEYAKVLYWENNSPAEKTIKKDDYMEVVRCKDCKNCAIVVSDDYKSERFYCRLWHIDYDVRVKGDDYCSYGVRYCE